MARRNRVTPFSTLVDEGRGTLFGNRGCLHDSNGRIVRPFAGRRWIACRLDFNGRHRDLMQPGRYTELFFVDEATALAAGHRPCRECRHDDHRSFVAAWRTIHPDEGGVATIDERLHAERVDAATRGQRRHRLPYAALPDGSFTMLDDEPWVVAGRSLLRWTPDGYAGARRRPRGDAVVLTPPSLVAVLAAGWRSGEWPLLHPSGRAHETG